MSAASSKAVVLLSGGLDSYTAAAIARDAGFEIYALTVKYGQRHGHEILAARKVAEALGVKAHRELAVDLATLGGSALLGDGEVPEGWAASRHDSGDLCARAEYRHAVARPRVGRSARGL